MLPTKNGKSVGNLILLAGPAFPIITLCAHGTWTLLSIIKSAYIWIQPCAIAFFSSSTHVDVCYPSPLCAQHFLKVAYPPLPLDMLAMSWLA